MKWNFALTGRHICDMITQWSFRKTGTMGTLASQAEVGVWVQAPKVLLRGSGILAPENFDTVYVQNPVV